jgi:LCP family protein required for cell wall assembly
MSDTKRDEKEATVAGAAVENAEVEAATASGATAEDTAAGAENIVSDAAGVENAEVEAAAAKAGGATASGAVVEVARELKSSAGAFLKRALTTVFFFEILFVLGCYWFLGFTINRWFYETGVAAFASDWPEAAPSRGGEAHQMGNINVLVLGIDSVEGTHRADTMFVLGINPSKASVNMLSIPRDTRVIVDGKGRKINEILTRYGYMPLHGMLEELLKIKIHRYVEMGFDGFETVVDLIGGVDLYIDKPMHYDDHRGNLHIHFDPGINHLNGKKALDYVRFRSDSMADLGRIKRQQQFVKALIDKITTPSGFVKLPKILGKAIEHIKTDFTLNELVTVLKAFNSYSLTFKNMSLPGEPRYIDKISYFMPYQTEALELGAAFFSDLTALELEKDYYLNLGNSANED